MTTLCKSLTLAAMRVRLPVIFVLVGALMGCKPHTAAVKYKPIPPDTTAILEPGIECLSTSTKRGGVPIRIWFYSSTPPCAYPRARYPHRSGRLAAFSWDGAWGRRPR